MREETLRAALERGLEAVGAPGLVAAARGPDGARSVIALGRRGKADPAPMTPDTLFWIASMTKLATSIAALQLVEAGRLSLDADAADRVPSLRDIPILSGTDAHGAPVLSRGVRPVTLRHLLTHTSGLGYAFMSPTLAAYAMRTGAGPTDTLPRLFEAGERWLYGASTDYVGQMVEAASGLGLDAYLAERVFGPLGMSETTFAPDAGQGARLASMHARTPDGGLEATAFALPPPPNPALGGGGLYAAASDYLTLLEALLAGGVGPRGRILSEASVALLTTDQVPGLECGRLESAIPAFTNAFEPLAGQSKGWTLGGLYSREDTPGGRRRGSVAWAGLSNCYYWFDPAAKAAGVVLMQFLPFADPAATRLFDAFEQAVYA